MSNKESGEGCLGLIALIILLFVIVSSCNDKSKKLEQRIEKLEAQLENVTRLNK